MKISSMMLGRFVAILSVPVMGMALASSQAKAQDAGVVISPDNTVLIRAKGKKWEPATKGAKIPAEAEVLSGGKTSIQAMDGEVNLEFRGDLAGINPYPIHETVVQMFPVEGDLDMDIAPKRGRVDLINNKKEGSASVKVRIFGETATVLMKTPGTRFTIEMFGRWKAGDGFSREQGKVGAPVINVIFLVIKGEVLITHKESTTKMTAPPGASMLMFNNLHMEQVAPDHLDELPAWAIDKYSPENPQIKARLESGVKFMTNLRETGSIENTLDFMAGSDVPSDRRLAIFAMGATDHLPKMWSTLLKVKSPDVMDDAVVALRHWIGREAGQDKKLWDYLVTERKYTEAQADQTLELLHSFGKEELRRPELYEHLILLLNAKREMTRVLAYWHLIRHAPEGTKIGYNPLSPPEERKAAAAKWAALLPKGKLPSMVSDDDETATKPKEK